MQPGALAQQFPLILPATPNLSTYHGYLEIQDGKLEAGPFWLRVDLKRPGLLRGATLTCEPALQRLLDTLDPHLLQARLSDSPDMCAYLVELRELVTFLVRQAGARRAPPARVYNTLLAQLDALGWDALLDLHPTLTSLRLQATDAAQRSHVVEITLPANYPEEAPSVTADLPEPLGLRWRPGDGVREVLTQFQAALARYQELWNCLEDLDTHAWVLDGVEDGSPRARTQRRLALGGHASLLLDVAPLAPTKPPTCRFLGAESRVVALRTKYFANLSKWRTERLLRANLEAMFEMPLPTPATDEIEDVTADCAICYAYQIPTDDGAGVCVPEHACDNAVCGRPFHASCLRDWLRANTATRQSFNTFFGACPYCAGPISVTVTD